MNRILTDIADELARIEAKWGVQNHPNGTGGRGTQTIAEYAKAMCQAAAAENQCTWRLILEEEVAEALAESDPIALRAELVQVAAVAAQWIDAIDRGTRPEVELVWPEEVNAAYRVIEGGIPAHTVETTVNVDIDHLGKIVGLEFLTWPLIPTPPEPPVGWPVGVPTEDGGTRWYVKHQENSTFYHRATGGHGISWPDLLAAGGVPALAVTR